VIGLLIMLVALVGCSTPRLNEAAALTVWTKRGFEAAELARLYCLAGSSRERRWMREAFEYHSAPAKVTIECPE
jgi:hypothetical protein